MRLENVKLGLYTTHDCIPTTDYVNYTNKILVLKPNYLSEEYRVPALQLFYCSFEGDYPNSRKDTALLGTFPATGTSVSHIHRSDILGILKPELVDQLGLDHI